MVSISIIIPVYNVEKYLRCCIDSILAQTFSGFELLLVDDGSTDSSGKICDEYASIDSRIRVIHKTNGGVSSARNMGLDNAHGSWIMFVDSDDFWCDKNILHDLYDMSNIINVDIIRGEYKSVDADGNEFDNRPINIKAGIEGRILNNWEFLQYAIAGEYFFVLCMIKKKAIGDLRFNENKVFLEDAEFFISLLSNDLKCTYINRVFYAYRKHIDSASNTIDIKHLKDSFDMCDFYWNIAFSVSDINIKKICRYNSIMMYYWTLQTLAAEPYYNDREKIINSLQLNQVHERVKSRVSQINIDWKYRPFIKAVPRTGVRILHFKDKLRSIFK